MQNPYFGFVNLLRSPRIDSQHVGPVRQPYLTYGPTGLHRLAESIPCLLKEVTNEKGGFGRSPNYYMIVGEVVLDVFLSL